MTCIDRKFSAFYSDIYMYGSMAVISWFSAASDWEVLKSKNPISVTMRGQPTMILLSWSWKTRLISKSFPGLWHLCVFLTPRESTMARRWQKSFWNNWPIQWYIYVLIDCLVCYPLQNWPNQENISFHHRSLCLAGDFSQRGAKHQRSCMK